MINEKYWKWRKNGMECGYAVRYPVGMKARHNCLFSLWPILEENYSTLHIHCEASNTLREEQAYALRESACSAQHIDNSELKYEKLNYIDASLRERRPKGEARKKIYIPVYTKLVKKEPKFIKLQKMLKKEINLLIIEVDGPKQESLNYYKEIYGVDDHFIENDTILITKNNLNIMLNDEKHAFGHGYVLAAALLDIEL
jgi:hypothetical protein